MPTLAQRKRAADIRQYFQEKWIKSDDWPAIAVDVKKRFGLDSEDWHRFRPLLKQMQAIQRQARPSDGQGPHLTRGEVREYFRKHLAHKVTDANQVRDEIMQRFGINKSAWYALVPAFKQAIAKARNREQSLEPSGTGNGELVVTQKEPAEPTEFVLEIPADATPASKACINILLAKNGHLVAEIQSRDVEIAGQRAQLAQGQGRSRLLKRIVGELLEAV